MYMDGGELSAKMGGSPQYDNSSVVDPETLTLDPDPDPAFQVKPYPV
jgi:hypothetical protein